MRKSTLTLKSLSNSKKSTVGRKRSNKSHSAIIKATQELLYEVGFDKLSIERVAAKAGVGKSTIYRWWESKASLAIEAFLEYLTPIIEFPETGSAADDLLNQINKVAEAYREKPGKIIREIIALGQFDESTISYFVTGYLEPRRTAAKIVLKRGVSNNEFNNDIDIDIVVDSLYGPIFHRMLTRHAAIDEAFVDSHVKLILRAIKPDD
ncbi:TetR/AcrR family transcriptional regulator [Brenneria populi]|uniref:TetR/AcrR family transcriptional regulator n=1 Tax=Brenneria populi TaxID=1505588 RepID=A0ABU6JWH5_9GAMM|nr:TetR/AcrR family transcriptional regulator [Brenneria populi Li et al. 2015]